MAISQPLRAGNLGGPRPGGGTRVDINIAPWQRVKFLLRTVQHLLAVRCGAWPPRAKAGVRGLVDIGPDQGASASRRAPR